MRKAIIGAASVLTVGLGGCGPSPDMPMHTQTRNAKEVTVKDNARATVNAPSNVEARGQTTASAVVGRQTDEKGHDHG